MLDSGTSLDYISLDLSSKLGLAPKTLKFL
jgi:hypothetical protein